MAKKRARQKALDPTLPIYQLKISLQHIEPLIWRRVQTDDCSLDELHEIIQAVMGWDDMHMYAFVIEGEEYGNSKRWRWRVRFPLRSTQRDCRAGTSPLPLRL